MLTRDPVNDRLRGVDQRRSDKKDLAKLLVSILAGAAAVSSQLYYEGFSCRISDCYGASGS